MTFLKSMMVAAALAVVGTAAQAQEKLKVVYHVSEVDRVGFALGNMQNHIDGVGGPENVELVLVAHGPALKAFHDLLADPRTSERVSALQEQGVDFEACGNTMNAQAVSLSDLLENFVRRDEGGVVRISELQSQGYMYIRP
jgi:intracellular sulfur oxidation DsrE/DsrF family protein